MKQRSTSVLLAVALACGTACQTGTGTGTQPDAPVPSGPPARWVGSAVFNEDVVANTGNWTNRFEVEVSWVKVDNPSPAPPPGTTRYVPTGRVHAIMHSYTDAGRCTVDRDGEFPVSPPAVALLPDEQQLDVGSDGRYQGKLYGSFRLDYLQYCRSLDRTFQNTATLYMSLDIAGTLDGGRIQGAMAPKVLTIESSLTSTRTGSWNFAAS